MQLLKTHKSTHLSMEYSTPWKGRSRGNPAARLQGFQKRCGDKYSILVLMSAVVVGAFWVSASIFASSRNDIIYPVAELGGCKSEQSCMAYCEKPANIKPCIAFAEKHNLFPKEELERAKKFAEVGSGPGGCASQASCESYCNDVNNINECVAFAEKEGFISGQELEEAKKVQAALAGGAKLPGGCRNKKDCDAYCQNPDKMEECISFAEAAGFIPPDELEEAKKALVAVKKGFKPPPCGPRPLTPSQSSTRPTKAEATKAPKGSIVSALVKKFNLAKYDPGNISSK